MAQTIETKGIVRELRESRQRVADLERELERLREDYRYVVHRARCLLKEEYETLPLRGSAYAERVRYLNGHLSYIMDRRDYYDAMYRFAFYYHEGPGSPEYALLDVMTARGYQPRKVTRLLTWEKQSPVAAALHDAMVADRDRGGRWCRRVLATIA